jgi:mannose-1-phosphate guanylyltransferase / mannose-6-phosphate isomerase
MQPSAPSEDESTTPTSKAPRIVPAILCGGAGSRLWPASRESMPKQFISLVGELSTFQAAAQRVDDPALFDRPLVLSHNDGRFIVAEQLKAIGIDADIVLEPTRRDSAAAVAVAAYRAAQRDPKALVLIMAADHVIGDADAFRQSCRRAAAAAEAGYIMTLGVEPTHPAEGYGYISRGAPIGGSGAFAVEKFVEKPKAEAASRYLEAGYLWNSGYFLFRADTMIAELEAHAPAVAKAARAALERAVVDLDFVRLDQAAFAGAPKISIDFAVMERTAKAGVFPVSFAWSDIGNWDAIWEVSPHDADGNATRGRVETWRTRNSLIHSEDVLTTVVGLDDVVVVAAPDAVLVASRKEAGAVKDLVNQMKDKAVPEVEAHLRMYRPWGWYQRVDLGQRFQVKRIMVKPGERLSLQKHFHRAEHWVVVRGTAEVTVNENVTLVHENEAVYIPIGAVHRLANPGRIPLELIEVQVGSYTGEDDIVRLNDVYGRST